jgi:hypothetical protein
MMGAEFRRVALAGETEPVRPFRLVMAMVSLCSIMRGIGERPLF